MMEEEFISVDISQNRNTKPHLKDFKEVLLEFGSSEAGLSSHEACLKFVFSTCTAALARV